jgi:hypothetical protein
MRTTFFLPALFAVSLLSGAALAEKPHGAADRLRARGDVVDKSYRADRHVVTRAPQRASSPVRQLPDRAASRVSCSDTSIDCPTATRGAARANGLAASGAQVDRPARAPAFLDKVLGSNRTSFNEAGEAQGMSSRAVKRAWSHGVPGAAGAAPGPVAQQKPIARAELQASQNRVSCNEGDHCMASSKASKKEWSYQAIKAGTWKGPEEKKVSGAEKVLAEMKNVRALKPEDAKHHP